jgi:hypothetical protein
MPLKPVSPLASSVIAVDEGDDATSSTLSFTLDASGTLHASTYAWTCTAVPGAGDPAYPTGTTTGAQTIDTPAAVSTNVTVTGPGRYVFTVTPDGDASKAQTVSVLVSRPLPVISVSGVTSGAGTPGATVTPAITDTGGADGPLTYLHAATRGSNGLGMVVTDATLATSSLTYPAQTAEGDSIGWAWVLTDAYGRTSRSTAVVNLPSPGDFAASTSIGDYVDTTSPYSYAPTLTIPAGATVATTITRISDASSVTVTDSTTTTPTATCTAADATVGEGFVAKSAVTLGGITKNVYTHIWMEGTAGADLTPPATLIDPINVANGTGSVTGIAIGNWSDSVTVTYTVLDDTGAASASASTASGSGAGPYTADVTGLDDDTAYIVRCRGEAADGQIADFCVSLTVGNPTTAGPAWSTVEEVDLTDGNVTTGSATSGSFTIYESDGTTPRIVGQIVSTGASGTVSWDSTGVRVEVTGGSSAMYAVFAVPVGDLDDEERDWHVDAVIVPTAVPASDIMLAWMGTSALPATGTSLGVDLQNTAGTYDIEVRRTTGGGVTYGLQELPGGIPASMSCRWESRGGDSVWVYWDSSSSAYLAADNSDATGGGKAHGTAGAIGATSLWGGTAYFALGGTVGVDAKIVKWRTQEYA